MHATEIKNPAPAATGTRPENINQIGKAMFQTSIAPTTDNSNDRTQQAWVTQVMAEVNSTRKKLEKDHEFTSWTMAQDDIWTLDDCVAKYLTTTRETWPAPERVPSWVSEIEVTPISYREIWLRMSHMLRGRTVAIQITLATDLDIGNGDVIYGKVLFHLTNSNDQYADFTLEQLQELTGLIAEAHELVEPSNKSRPLERRTEPGSPDTAGIGGGL